MNAVVVFDTRIDKAPWLTGVVSRGIARARAWGSDLAASLATPAEVAS